MLFCGVDWASDHHDICIVDADRWIRRIAHDPTGIAELRAAITTQEPDPANVCVAVEINHRLIVGALVEAGYVVDPINPQAAERFRDRREPGDSKNDRLDAAGPRPTRAGARAHSTRQPAAVGAGRVLPAALVAFDLDADSALAFLERYPTPEAAARLSAFQIAAFLRARRAKRDLAAKAAAAKDAFRAQALRARPEIARAQARRVRVVCAQLRVRRHPQMLLQSGKRAVVKARAACPKEFRDAVQQWADQ